MNWIWDALVRALRDAFRARVLWWSLLPLALLMLAALLLLLALVVLTVGAWWGDVLQWVQAGLQARLQAWGWPLADGLLWLLGVLLLVVAVHGCVLGLLLLCAVLLAPAMAALVARQRFPGLQSLRGGSWWGSVWVTLGCGAIAALALLLSLPLWLVPPMAMVLPTLIAGWLTYRVMVYDTLAVHASAGERRQLLRQHRWHLWAMGVGYVVVGALPAALWWTGWLMLLGMWLYAWWLAIGALWFAHYTLNALYQLRAQQRI